MLARAGVDGTGSCDQYTIAGTRDGDAIGVPGAQGLEKPPAAATPIQPAPLRRLEAKQAASGGIVPLGSDTPKNIQTRPDLRYNGWIKH